MMDLSCVLAAFCIEQNRNKRAAFQPEPQLPCPTQAAVAPLPPASSPPASLSSALLPADPLDGLLDRLANYLVPLFVTDAEDMRAARLMAVRTIAAYLPETQADLINIGRTIAFSMSALAALGRVASEDMPPALQLRDSARATVLNRAAEQSERSMERRRGNPKVQCAAAGGRPDSADRPWRWGGRARSVVRRGRLSRPRSLKRSETILRSRLSIGRRLKRGRPCKRGQRRAGGGSGRAAPASYQRSAQPGGPIRCPAWLTLARPWSDVGVRDAAGRRTGSRARDRQTRGGEAEAARSHSRVAWDRAVFSAV